MVRIDLHILTTRELKEGLKKLAEIKGISISIIINGLIAKELKKYDLGQELWKKIERYRLISASKELGNAMHHLSNVKERILKFAIKQQNNHGKILWTSLKEYIEINLAFYNTLDDNTKKILKKDYFDLKKLLRRKVFDKQLETTIRQLNKQNKDLIEFQNRDFNIDGTPKYIKGNKSSLR